MIFKVIDDNGYKVELLRPIRSPAMPIGMAVEVTCKKSTLDLVKLFDGLLDEETQNMLFDKFNEAKKETKNASVRTA